MPASDLIILLWVLIAANVVLIFVAIIWSQLRRRRVRAATPVNRTQANRQDSDGVPVAPSAIGRGYLATARPEPEQVTRSTDRLTGLLGPTDWNRLVADEDIRYARYKRAATVVMIELDGLDRLVTALGQLAADRVLAAVGDTIHRHARKADHVARLGPSRFGVLLPETDEVTAINYVERVREASDLWLESGAISLRLAIGWASPVVDSSLVNAQAQAIERMFVEIHRGTLRDRDSNAGPTTPVPGMKGAPSAV
jgi:diguanylate cyclase (GGDEF)-like protein